MKRFLLPLVASGLVLALSVKTVGGEEGAPGKPVAEEPAKSDTAPQKPRVHAVRRGTLVLSVDREGRLDAAAREKLRVLTEAHGGPLEVAEVLRKGGPVASGEVVVRFDPARLKAEHRAASEAVEQLRKRVEQLAAERRLLEDSNRTRIERAEGARLLAEQALALFESHEGPKMLREGDLAVKDRENGVRAQREELEQLEKMYEGTSLASGTKEIVLDRARRALEQAEAYLAIARAEAAARREQYYPQRLRRLKDELRWTSEDLEQTRESVRLAVAQKRAEIDAQKIALRDAEERLTKLASDLSRLTLRAPCAGLLTPIELEPGDLVEPRRVLGEVVDPSRLVVKLLASAEDLRLLVPGRRVEVSFPEYPELALVGTVAEVCSLGAPAEGATQFATRVALDGGSPLLKIGMRARISAEEAIAETLLVPRKAVRVRGGKAFCYVLSGTARESRAVRLGAASAEWIEVRDGLREGEEVLLEGFPDEEPPLAPPKKVERGGGGASAACLGVLFRGAARAAASLGGAAASGSAPGQRRASAAGEPPPGAPAASRAVRAYARGVDFLVHAQNADGSWGSFESARPGEIYLGTIASHHAFLEATTALATLALLEPSRTDPACRAALERGLAHLVAAEPAARATGDTYYDTWTHAYLVAVLAALSRDERFAASREAIITMLRREIGILERRQAADGGWSYYDFGYSRETPSGHLSASFLTAVVLLALDEAGRAGFPAAPSTISDGLRCLERYRLPSGAYIYGTYAELYPGALFNWAKGSLGRSQPCNLALWVHRRGVSREDLLAGLMRLKEHHRFPEIGKSRPYPHESWYYTSGYYFLFGHYYAARVALELEPADRALFQAWIAETLARLQNDDGSWSDYPLYGYHKEYGTAFALLALEACLGRMRLA